MLVLSRKLNESICIGQDIVVKIVKIRGNVVGLGIIAPDHVKVMRNELLERDGQVIAPRSRSYRSGQAPNASPVADQVDSAGESKDRLSSAAQMESHQASQQPTSSSPLRKTPPADFSLTVAS